MEGGGDSNMPRKSISYALPTGRLPEKSTNHHQEPPRRWARLPICIDNRDSTVTLLVDWQHFTFLRIFISPFDLNWMHLKNVKYY
jgi:hypothetical protein